MGSSQQAGSLHGDEKGTPDIKGHKRTGDPGGVRDAVQLFRDGTRKPKAHLQLNLVRDMKGNKRGFYKYLSSKMLGKTWAHY